MKYLIYCIFENPRDRKISVCPGLGKNPVHVIERQGLCAAYSENTAMDEVRDTSEMMTYHKVIQSFFEQVTVVPFRFGTVLDLYVDLERLLENRAEHYRKILQDLEGCAEMGIRAIINACEIQGGDPQGSPGIAYPDSSGSGKLYLSSRKNHYSSQSLLSENNQQSIRRVRDTFAGTFKKFKSESSTQEFRQGGASFILLSLYFLVPKALLERFRQTFADLSSAEPAKLMLSGPWPPYNFVLPGEHPVL
jgi:hypothetical protein